jgi:hypothetical protein
VWQVTIDPKAVNKSGSRNSVSDDTFLGFFRVFVACAACVLWSVPFPFGVRTVCMLFRNLLAVTAALPFFQRAAPFLAAGSDTRIVSGCSVRRDGSWIARRSLGMSCAARPGAASWLADAGSCSGADWPRCRSWSNSGLTSCSATSRNPRSVEAGAVTLLCKLVGGVETLGSAIPSCDLVE